MARSKSSRPSTQASGPAGLVELWKRFSGHPNAAEAAHMALREAILHGVLEAGHRLSETQLGTVFGCSRTPVREATLKLETEGLAERLPRRGLVVAHVTREDQLEVYVVKEMLDGLSARLAALAILPAELDRLVWLNDRFRVAAEQQDARAMVHLNIEFHESICRSTRNSLLQDFMGRLHQGVRRFSDTTMSFGARGQESVVEHDRLIEAIRARDGDAAEKIARDHMARARQIRMRMMQAVAAGELHSTVG